ncbi:MULTISPECIES: helix-turn-helix domain-containing protein [unclassified Ruegeria]|uniref:helix-turn-helix domain-containing protein n=1 Tax=unclassified Ruegeria TaxID=2625375 RepID=UPI0014887EF5|nr:MULTISPECIES: helix-turn-helix domain-containing protein [unclassified Ruegeria]
MYQSAEIRSIEDLPVYNDVEFNATALCPQGPRLTWQSAKFADVGIHIESLRSRVRYQEIQYHDTIYYGLFLPNGDPVRFQGLLYQTPFIVCWQGLGPTEFDYVVETGTQIYMLEVPRAVAEQRGWADFEAPIRLTKSDALNSYIRSLETCLILGQSKSATNPNPVFNALAQELERLMGDALFCSGREEVFSKSDHGHWKIVTAAEALLMDDNNAGITIQELCRLLGVPRRSLYAAFEKQIGLGPGKFQTLIRLHRLRSLLLNTPYEKGVVSKLVGEAGFNHFGRTSVAYRRFFGESPIDTVKRS